MISNLTLQESILITHYQDEEFRAVSFAEIVGLTVREICNANFVFRFFLPNHGRVYFTESEKTLSKLKLEGKEVRWFHELIEYWRQDLIMRGFPSDISIYHWRLKDISILQKGLIILAPSEVEVRQ